MIADRIEPRAIITRYVSQSKDVLRDPKGDGFGASAPPVGGLDRAHAPPEELVVLLTDVSGACVEVLEPQRGPEFRKDRGTLVRKTMAITPICPVPQNPDARRKAPD